MVLRCNKLVTREAFFAPDVVSRRGGEGPADASSLRAPFGVLLAELMPHACERTRYSALVLAHTPRLRHGELCQVASTTHTQNAVIGVGGRSEFTRGMFCEIGIGGGGPICVSKCWRVGAFASFCTHDPVET